MSGDHWVLGVDVGGDRLRSTKTSAGTGMSVLEADLGDPETCRSAVGTCIAEFGGLDVLGNVAGIFRAHHVVDVTPAEYRRIPSVDADQDVAVALQLGGQGPAFELGERPLAAANRRDDDDGARVAAGGADESELPPVRRPRRAPLVGGRLREPKRHLRADLLDVDVHGPAVRAGPREGDLLAVGREGRLGLGAGEAREGHRLERPLPVARPPDPTEHEEDGGDDSGPAPQCSLSSPSAPGVDGDRPFGHEHERRRVPWRTGFVGGFDLDSFGERHVPFCRCARCLRRIQLLRLVRRSRWSSIRAFHVGRGDGGDQAIAGFPDGLDVLRGAGVVAEDLPELGDAARQHVVRDHGAGPHALHELVLRHRAAGLRGEAREHLHHLGLQPHGAVRPDQPVPSRGDEPVAHAKVIRSRCAVRSLIAHPLPLRARASSRELRSAPVRTSRFRTGSLLTLFLRIGNGSLLCTGKDCSRRKDFSSFVRQMSISSRVRAIPQRMLSLCSRT